MNQLVVAMAALIVAAAAFPFPGPADEETPAGVADPSVRAERQAAFLRGRSRLSRDEVSCTHNEF